MNYSQAIKWLNGFINYEKTPPKSHAELNLERMRYGLEVLNHSAGKKDQPAADVNFFPILIAGTVGKGSTGFFLEQILRSAKISCGFYHSPHIDDIRERIRVDGKMLPEKKWAAEIAAIQKLLRQKPFPKKLGQPTYFEILTLLAIQIFSKKNLRAGIFEIGMGGRLDATNVLNAPLCILTRVDLDHQAFLGNTLRKIAREKSGIIKSAPVVVSAPQEKSVMKVFRTTAPQKGRLQIARPTVFQPGLSGKFQKQNAGNAALAAQMLREKFYFNLQSAAIKKGLKANGWPGRLDAQLFQKRKIMMDAAHNPAGCRELIASLRQLKAKPVCLLFSALRDKDSAAMLKILSVLKIPVIVTSVHHARTKSLANLAAEAEAFFDKIIPARDTAQGLELLMRNTAAGKTALVTGSFYLLGEFRKILNDKAA